MMNTTVLLRNWRISNIYTMKRVIPKIEKKDLDGFEEGCHNMSEWFLYLMFVISSIIIMLIIWISPLVVD